MPHLSVTHIQKKEGVRAVQKGPRWAYVKLGPATAARSPLLESEAYIYMVYIR
jgi:hypothetical protein